PSHPRATPAPRPAVGPSQASRAGRAPLLVPAVSRVSTRPTGGLDLGWLAACIAMVAAAALLGRPRATSRSLRRAFHLPLAGARSEPERP
ncbi:MAG TPA: hypothetical protein VJT75_18215, partial [Thermoleophilaceae bacterium]|nr:hypothetical protein [Thermoleophilaceae bacterium]